MKCHNLTQYYITLMGFHYSNCDYGSFDCSEPERCDFCGEYESLHVAERGCNISYLFPFSVISSQDENSSFYDYFGESYST